jgi:tetratricopeptide (TPR) repeat protein
MALGRNELREEHAAEAEEIFRRTDRFQTQAVQLIKLLIRSGRAAEAMPRLDAALKQFPMSLEFHFLRYRALLELDRPEEAAKVADLFDRLRPTISLNFNTDYVRHYRKRTGFDEAIEEYNQLISDRNMDRMAAVLEELLKEIGTLPVPMASTVQVSLAEVELQRQRSERILELVHTLHLTEVEGADVLQLEGAALQMQGHHAQAVALWERAMQMGPNPQLAEKLAEEADRIKDTRKRDHWRAQAALLQTRELFWNNRIEEALPPVRQALQLDGENPQAWYYLGQVQRVRGDFPAAREAYEKCLQLAPWYGRADAALRLLPAT